MQYVHLDPRKNTRPIVQFAQKSDERREKMKKPSMETRLEATKLLEGISDAEFQYVLGVFTELKAIGKELHANIMQERRDFYDGISTAETKDDSEAREIQWINDARQQANILWGRAVERGVSANMLDLLSYAIEQYI